MATDQHTVRLNLEAQDNSSRTLKQVQQQVKGLTDSLGEQIALAKTGKVSYKELDETYRRLLQTQQALNKQQANLNGLEAAEKKLADVKKRADDAAKAYEALQQSYAGKDTISDKEAQRLERAQQAAERTAQRLQAAQAALDQRRGAATDFGLNPDDRLGSTTALAAQARDTAAAMAPLRAAMDTYHTTLRQVRQEEDARNAVLASAQNQLAVAAREAIALADANQRATGDLQKFRQLADSIEAVGRGYSTLGDGAVNAGVSAQRTIKDLLDPAQAARSTFDGLKNEIESVAAATNNITGPVKDYSQTLGTLAAQQRELVRQAGLVDAFKAQRAAVIASRDAFLENGRATDALTQQMRSATTPSKELADQAMAAAKATAASRDELQRQITTLRATAAAAKDAGLDLKNLAQTENQLADLAQKVNASQGNLTAGQATFGSAGGRGGGIFGLTPYGVQNLSFQINDLFTQVASGTSIFQALAQQGGQVYQIFQQTEGGVARLLRAFPLLVAVLGTAALAWATYSRQQEIALSTRNFEGRLRASADGAKYNAQALTNMALAAQRSGADFQQARQALITFVGAGMEPGSLNGLLQTARDVSKVMGIELPDAAKQLADGLNNGFQGVTKLNESLNFLSVEQNKAIRDAFQAGDANKAYELTLQALQERMSAGAAAMKGPWSDAANDLKGAWRGLLDYIGDSRGYQVAVEWLGRVARAARGAIEAVNRARNAGPLAEAQNRVSDIRQRLNTTAGPSAGTSFMDSLGTGEETGLTSRQREALTAELKEAEAQVERLTRSMETNTGAVEENSQATNADRIAIDNRRAAAERAIATSSRATAQQRIAARQEQIIQELTSKGASLEEAREIANRETQDEMDALAARNFRNQQARERLLAKGHREALARVEERARKEAEANRLSEEETQSYVMAEMQAEAARLNSRQRSGAAAARAIENQERDLANKISALRAQTDARDKDSLDSRLRAIDERYQNLFRTLDQFRARGGTQIEGKSLDQYRAEVEAEKARQRVFETQRFQREQYAKAEQDVNRIVQERNALLQTNEALFKSGEISYGELQTRNREAYSQTNTELTAAITKLEEFARAALAAGSITQAQFDLMTGKVQMFRSQMQYVDPTMTALRKGVESGFTSSLTTGFDNAAESVGKLLAGVQSTGETFKSMGNIALQVLAQLSKAVAQAILQQYALAAAAAIARAFGAPSVGGAAGAAAGQSSGAAAGASVGAALLHSGGVVGAPGGRTVEVSPHLFNGAPRYHTGGTVGLAPDEQAAVLRVGEEVLTEDSPRNAKNGGTDSGGGGVQSIRNVLVMDESMLTEAMQSPAGERVVVTHIKKNAASVRKMLGV